MVSTSYGYDADGNQLLVQDPTSTILYLPGEELAYSNSTKKVTGTRYYTVNGQTTAVRVGRANPVYLDGDQYRTMQTEFDRTGQTVTRRQFDPHDNQVGQTTTNGAGSSEPGVWPDPHGFLDSRSTPA
jgi:hypothetical protein